MESIAHMWQAHHVLVDPHTAVACAVAHEDQTFAKQEDESVPLVIAATASPFKFPASCLAALNGERIPPPREMDDLAHAYALSALTGLSIPRPIAALSTAKIQHTNVVEEAQLEVVLQDFSACEPPMIEIEVPATSANLGPGFDCLGIALTLSNKVRIERAEKTALVGCPPQWAGKDNLFLTSFQHAWERLSSASSQSTPIKRPPEIHADFDTAIPAARGLGSSASLAVAALQQRWCVFRYGCERHRFDCFSACQGTVELFCSASQATSKAILTMRRPQYMAALLPQRVLQKSS